MSQGPTDTFTLRPDLIRQRIGMGDRFVWVLKDPLSRAFFYFSDREYSILRLLNGRRQLGDVITECKRRCAPDFVPIDTLVGFLATAKQNGLIVSSALSSPETPRNQSTSSPTSRIVFNPLAIRLPGINPDRSLDALGTRLAFLFSPAVVALATMAIVVASLLTILNLNAFVAHITAATQRSSLHWVLLLALVIVGTKVVHELAHAVACKSFGAECRELGIMFLVGIPCLYCDVSDAWMLPQRWKRIMVSAAGMLAELSLATIAMCLWLLSTDSVVRDLCVTTMVVCSVSTVLFNGNPLLRYDGYFILSDLLGIPNLAAESSKLIRGTLRRWLWSLPAVKSPPRELNKRRVKTIVLYGVLSGVYRFAVLIVIGLVLYRLASSVGLGAVGGLLVGILIAATIWRSLKSIINFPTAVESRSALSTRRPVTVLSMLGLALFVAGVVPLPYRVTAPLIIQASGAIEIFVESPGQLVYTMPAGSLVQTGEPIAKLRNEQTQFKLLELQATVDLLQTELNTLHQRRALDAVATRQIPAVSKTLDSAQRQLALLREEAERLVIEAPTSGRLLPPRNRIENDSAPEADLKTWDGSPLDAENVGAFLDQGTRLGAIGDPRSREALVLVRQQDIAMVRPGQQVDVVTQSAVAGRFRGIVTEIASSPVVQVPREFFAAGLVDSAGSTNPEQTRNTYYQVRVALNDSDTPPLLRSTARARISVEPVSLMSRLIRFVRDSFRF